MVSSNSILEFGPSIVHQLADQSVLNSLTPQPGKWQSYIWYNFERRYSFCGVAKVASSTWRSHNRDLVGQQRFDAYLKVQRPLTSFLLLT